ncbi:PHD finger protein 7-like [Athene cunicularia]|uniref:PHD finger protein 7-like n=1 Tax=Athene cunicularia TaxID=194338 RepID=UPI000EF65EB8|nr:PHD finger protein 7-like [Athene cunicularia]
MAERREEAPDLMEQGESKVSLPQHSKGAVGAVSVGPSAVAGGVTACDAPSLPQPPALPLTPQGRSRALGTIPQGCFPRPAEVLIPAGICSLPPACVLCGRAAADLDLWGPKIETEGLCAHRFCMFFAGELLYWQDEESGLLGILPEDILHTVELAAQKRCFICGESRATITCCQEDCDLSFHLPCAMEGECITQYLPPHSSFCREHRPEQEVEAAPEENTKCLICLEPVEDRKSFHTLVCPVCKHAWYHRVCIQGHALSAGMSFSCPHCRNEHNFIKDMLIMGIRVPMRLSSWENEPQDEILIEGHSHCDAHECLCPGGREYAEEQG